MTLLYCYSRDQMWRPRHIGTIHAFCRQGSMAQNSSICSEKPRDKYIIFTIIRHYLSRACAALCFSKTSLWMNGGYWVPNITNMIIIVLLHIESLMMMVGIVECSVPIWQISGGYCVYISTAGVHTELHYTYIKLAFIGGMSNI